MCAHGPAFLLDYNYMLRNVSSIISKEQIKLQLKQTLLTKEMYWKMEQVFTDFVSSECQKTLCE